MNWKRVLRIAVCLVLVCTLVVGISPIRAKAVYVPVFSDAMALGLVVIVLGMATGFIPPPTLLMDQVEAVGEAFERAIDDLVYDIQFPSGPDDPDDLDDDEKTELEKAVEKARSDVKKFAGTVVEQTGSGMSGLEPSALVGTLLGAFIYDCIEKGYFETEVEVPTTDGWAYYGDYFLPIFPTYDGYLYQMVMDTGTAYSIIHSSAPFRFSSSSGPGDAKSISATDFIGDYAFYSDITTNYNPYNFKYSRSGTKSVSQAGVVSPAYDGVPVWANFDVTYYNDPSIVRVTGSTPKFTVSQIESVEPIATVGPIVDGIKAGALKAADIPIPEAVDFTSIFEGIETSGVAAISNNLANKATEITNGSLSIDDFRESITYTDSSSDGSEGNEQIPTDSTLSNFPVLNFFSRLGQLLQDIMNGNLLGVKNFFNPWFESIGQWFQDIRGDISGVRDDLSGIDSSVQDVVDSNSEQNDILEQGFSTVSSVVAGAISNAASDVVDAVKSTVVPEEDFLTNKVNALCDEFSFADSIVKTGQALHLGLANISTEPPVIYIDLGASRGSHYLGGQVPFLDLRWYAEYKPTVDTIISAFLWICFVWKMFLNLPGIISGMPGDFNAHAAENMGVAPYLPARSAEYEHIRILNRRSMHRRE